MRAMFGRLALVLVTAIGLTACATKTPPEKLVGIKTVAVVAATGDRLNWSTKPTLGWTQSRVIPVHEWNLDKRIEALASTALTRRYSVVPATGIDLALLTSVEHFHAIDYLVRHAELQKSGIDAVLLFREGSIDINNPSEGPPRLRGIGILRRNSLIGPVITAYAVLEATLIDLKTSKQIAMFRTRLPDNPWVNARVSHPLGPHNEDIWFDPFESTPADKTERIQQMVSDLLEQSVPYTLEERGLLD